MFLNNDLYVVSAFVFFFQEVPTIWETEPKSWLSMFKGYFSAKILYAQLCHKEAVLIINLYFIYPWCIWQSLLTTFYWNVSCVSLNACCVCVCLSTAECVCLDVMAELPSGLLEACVVVGAPSDKLRDIYQVCICGDGGKTVCTMSKKKLLHKVSKRKDVGSLYALFNFKV